MEDNFLYTGEQPVNEKAKRPQYLTVLCILSFIWSGLMLLCLFLGLCFSRYIFEMAEKLLSGAEGMPPMAENQQQAIQVLIDLGPQKFLMGIAIAIIIYMTSLLGVVKMWKLQKFGFFIYAAVNGLGLSYDVISGSYFMAAITITFIGMYFSNLKHMK
ncbi:MAG: hypothetical protein V4677_08460 [Bacteroidota bacterium]